MSIQPEDLDDELDEQPDESSVIRQLRRQTKDQANELKSLREQADRTPDLERKLAVYEANLGDLNEAQQKAVLATANEMSADALRSQAELLGFIAPPAPTAPVEDIQAFDRVAQATAGGGAPDAASYDAELAEANTEAEMIAVMRKYNKPIVA